LEHRAPLFSTLLSGFALTVIIALAVVVSLAIVITLAKAQIFNKIIIKCYSRSLCKTLEVFACASANLGRASDLPDPSVSGWSERVREGEEQVRGLRGFAMMVVIAGGRCEGGDFEPPESRWSINSVLWDQSS
jgi:hypothetical protein